MPEPRPSPAELYEPARGDKAEYRRLLIAHGLLVPLAPGETAEPLPCGWPGPQRDDFAPRRSMTEQTPEQIAEAILADVGRRQMGDLYAAIPDLIHDHYPPYQHMDLGQRKALVQAVAEQIGGEGYVYDYPVH